MDIDLLPNVVGCHDVVVQLLYPVVQRLEVAHDAVAARLTRFLDELPVKQPVERSKFYLVMFYQQTSINVCLQCHLVIIDALYTICLV